MSSDNLNSYGSDGESQSAALAGWTLATMNVGAVCTVVVSAFAARKLRDVLQMICTGFPGISHDQLTVLVPESDCGRA